MSGPNADALPNHPARVRVTLKGGAVRWLADRPDARMDEPGEPGASRWRLVDTEVAAGVFGWQPALVLAKEADNRWRQQYAVAVPVVERAAVGAEARVRALACQVDGWEAVGRVVFGPDVTTFGFTDGRAPLSLPPLVPVG